jgi:metal-responsive CopG/Arc/MetJ family transcriptional regulator
MVVQTEKVTISIPRDLLSVTDEIAKEKKISRSKVVSSCLREMADKHFREKMAEGYKKLAKENLRFTKDAIKLAKETLPEWE